MRQKILYLSMVIFMLISIGMIQPVAADIGVNINLDDKDSIVRIFEDVVISEDKDIGGDVVVIMGDIKLDGRVSGDVVAIGGDIDVNNYVGGDMVSVMGNIRKGTNAEIRGNITEVSMGNLNNIDLGFPVFFSGLFGWYFRVVKLIVSFGLVVLVFSFMPRYQRNMVKAIKKQPWRKLIVGIITSLLIPVVTLLFAITIIGIPLIPVLIILLVVAKFIGYVVIVYIVGERIADLGNSRINIYLQLFFGVAALWILNAIPVIGVISYLIITFIALGVVIDTKFGTNRPWFKRKDIIDEE